MVLNAAAQEVRDMRRDSSPKQGTTSTRNQRRRLAYLKRKDLQDCSAERRLRGDYDPRPKGLGDQFYRRVRACMNDASGRAAGCIVYQLPVYTALQLVSHGLTPHTAMGRRAIAFAYIVYVGVRGRVGGAQLRGKNRNWFGALLADPHNEKLTREQHRPSVRTLSEMMTALDRPATKAWHVPGGLDVVRRWQAPDDVAAKEEWLPHAKRPTSRYYVSPAPHDFDVVDAFDHLSWLMGDTLPDTREPAGLRAALAASPATPEEVTEIRRLMREDREAEATGPPDQP